MLSFLLLAGLALVAALAGTTGLAHLLGLGGFVRLLRSHGVIPGVLAPLVALTVTTVEVALAGAAVTGLARGEPSWILAVFAVATALGLVFLVYLGRLVRSGHQGSCGCTPLAGPTTTASLIPAATLVVAGALGWGAAWLGGDVTAPDGAAWLAVGWGVTLAALTLLLPATVPGRIPEVTS